MGLSVKVQCMDLDSFSLNPHSLYFSREHVEAGLDSVGCFERIMVDGQDAFIVSELTSSDKVGNEFV